MDLSHCLALYEEGCIKLLQHVHLGYFEQRAMPFGRLQIYEFVVLQNYYVQAGEDHLGIELGNPIDH